MFKRKDVVVWVDPDEGHSTGVYTVYDDECQDNIGISNMYSSAEVPSDELHHLSKHPEAIYGQYKYELFEGVGGNLDDFLSMLLLDEETLREYLKWLMSGINQFEDERECLANLLGGEDTPRDRELSDKIFFLQEKAEIVKTIMEKMGV